MKDGQVVMLIQPGHYMANPPALRISLLDVDTSSPALHIESVAHSRPLQCA